MENKKWDAFISHASEDKDSLVRELTTELQKFHLKVWYDEFSLNVGDSLSKSIDEGLIYSNFGIIIISPDFLKKRWTDYEYRSLLSKEIDGQKIILPIWHNITKEEIRKYSLYLSDKFALDSSKESTRQLTIKLLKVIRPDIYQDLCRYISFKKLIANSESVVVNRSELKHPKERNSILSKQLLVRAKSIFYGIGQNLSMSLNESIYNYELDIRPEREIQTWEIMNSCYLEFIHKHNISDLVIKKEITKVLVTFSIGKIPSTTILSEEQIIEITKLWSNNIYEY